MSPEVAPLPCPICASQTVEYGKKYGDFGKRWYEVRHCPACRYTFVANPWTEFEKIYTEAYYNQKGADPYVDYAFELDHPSLTVRQYEWRGLLAAITSLKPLSPSTRWLDFGCGNGGLVRHVREHANCQIVGFEEGWIRDRAMEKGIPFISKDELESTEAAFDIVTAIEVLEHVSDPLVVLAKIRKLLKPGGLFFYTTGNARPNRKKLLEWGYFLPDIHVSLYEPETLALALRKSGFRAEFSRYSAGLPDIVRFKVLKTRFVRSASLLERCLPWGGIAKLVNWRFGVNAHPIGWAEAESK